MPSRFHGPRITAAIALLMLAAAVPAQERPPAELEQRIEALENRLARMEHEADQVPPSSVVHLTGYAAVGYSDAEGAPGTFDQVSLSPVLHYMYKDLILLESEFEFSVDEDGETETDLEYATLDLFMHDNAVLAAGKFLSPIGQFRQNIHPAWINKLPSAPPGFGHDGAAPLAEVGAQVRGGFSLAGRRSNYAVFVGNGPRAEIEGDEIHGVDTEGFASNEDGDEVWGGRFAIVPWPQFELGVSGAAGKIGLFDDSQSLIESGRDYDVVGADFVYHLSLLEFRGEYVRQRIASDSGSVVPEEFKWTSWYGQAAYRIAPTRWEAVLRHGDFDSPHVDGDQRQWAAGLDYWFAGNVVGKLAYEWNDGRSGTEAEEDRVLLQMAYGF